MAKEPSIQEYIDQRLNAFAQKMYADIQILLDGVLADRLDNDSLPEPILNESVVSQDHSDLDSRDRLLLAGLGQQQKELLEFSRNIMAALGSQEKGLRLIYEGVNGLDSDLHTVTSIVNKIAIDSNKTSQPTTEDFWATKIQPHNIQPEQDLVLPEQPVTSIEEQPIPPSTYAWRNGPDPSQYRTGFPDGKGSFN